MIVKAIIAPTDMEEIRTTEPMFILREKVRVRLPSNLLLRAAEYDTARTYTVLPIRKINAAKR